MRLIQKPLLVGMLLSLSMAGLVSSTLSWAEKHEITLYNQGFALVKDYRDVTLENGLSQFSLDNVAALIDPTSVHFKSLSHPEHVVVEEQNFRYDLISKTNVLNRMVGKTIRFVQKEENGRSVVRQGTLLTPATSYQVSGSRNTLSQRTASEFAVQTSDGILLTNLQDILVDQLPEGLYPRPTLVWDIWTDKPGKHRSEVTYMTKGMSWEADYVAVVNKTDTRTDLTSWVTLNNQSGTSFNNSTLKLVAGDVRTLQPQAAPYARSVDMLEASAAPKGAGFSEESFFEYHLYTLGRKTSLAHNETKQLSLIQSNDIPISKQFVFDANRARRSRRSYTSKGSNDQSVSVFLNFKNSESNHLGVPLPKGRVRVYKADSSGELQFIGEDRIQHTPKEKTLELYIGDAFDVTGSQKTVSSRRIGNHTTEVTYQVELHNQKKSAVEVDVLGHTYGNWKIRDNSHQYTSDDAYTVRFPVKVAAGGDATLTYTVVTKRR